MHNKSKTTTVNQQLNNSTTRLYLFSAREHDATSASIKDIRGVSADGVGWWCRLIGQIMFGGAAWWWVNQVRWFGLHVLVVVLGGG
eukprot:m.231256 g.231256  ORF g.231256 m.231256 type:complete len:86 (+) comp33599_c1_seq11:190-447(+)